MLPKFHIIIGLIITIIFFFVFNISVTQSIIIWLASFLIDVDHYLYFVGKKKKISLQQARKFFFEYRAAWLKLDKKEKIKYKKPIFLFHGIECWIILTLISLAYSIVWFVLFGFAIHMTLDYFELLHYKFPLYSKTSQLMVFALNKNKLNFR